MKESKIADSVWHRVVQIVQEAMLTCTDCADLLRQVRVVPDESDPHVLVLSSEYEEQVRAGHKRMLEQAKELAAQRTGNKFIIPDDSDNN